MKIIDFLKSKLDKTAILLIVVFSLCAFFGFAYLGAEKENTRLSGVIEKSRADHEVLVKTLEENGVEKDALRKEVSVCKESSAKSIDFSSDLILFLGEKLDEMDGLWVEDQANNVDMINWFYANAKFSNAEMPAAQSRYENWLRQNDSSIKKYYSFKSSLSADLEDYLEAVPSVN